MLVQLQLALMTVPSPDAIINPPPSPPSHQSPWTSYISLNKKRPLEEQSTKLVMPKPFVVLNLNPANRNSLHQPSILDIDSPKALQQAPL
jgi:hypothetical protein